ncbi:DUF2889 domain-containing protein [Cupriavidus lacunae]|uniref:DUF2889 domain-containing protein n=1 Tax=Cupriavidus lacunae TaxID=2666307 RepID=A0A370NJS1_9BURK|nr:DUF2889 domain-containing protein [Cupriavidus lacunae]RDK05852.1 hypothetical protein DN412_34675 [Cupriavidus lacunae]
MKATKPNSQRIQLRQIQCESLQREDGLIDLVATLIDTRPTPLALPARTVPAGSPVHQMELRITIDDDRLIHEVEARTLHSPYTLCAEVEPAYTRLVGMRIEPGFNEEARRLFRGIAGCTHMTELIPVLGTAAFQAIWGRAGGFGGPSQGKSPLGGCHALRIEGPVVQTYFRHLLDQDAHKP